MEPLSKGKSCISLRGPNLFTHDHPVFRGVQGFQLLFELTCWAQQRGLGVGEGPTTHPPPFLAPAGQSCPKLTEGAAIPRVAPVLEPPEGGPVWVTQAEESPGRNTQTKIIKINRNRGDRIGPIVQGARDLPTDVAKEKQDTPL